jgi:hypothetical protein
VKIRKYQTDKCATCSDCELEWWGKNCEADAKQHTKETGHITTLHIQMDVAKFDD